MSPWLHQLQVLFRDNRQEPAYARYYPPELYLPELDLLSRSSALKILILDCILVCPATINLQHLTACRYLQKLSLAFANYSRSSLQVLEGDISLKGLDALQA
jgi:hypothetical protein